MPGVDAIEDLEYERPEKRINRIVGCLRDDDVNEELAYSIRRPVYVREPVRRKNDVIRPWRRLTACPPMEDSLPLSREPPVGIKDGCRPRALRHEGGEGGRTQTHRKIISPTIKIKNQCPHCARMDRTV